MSQSFSDPKRISFIDRLLPDDRVERTYSNGGVEWRVGQAPDRISWVDNQGQQGVDLDLGGGQVRRENAIGQVWLGQNLGNGITSWNGGQYVTVNETVFPEPSLTTSTPLTGIAGIVAGLGLGWLFGLNATPYGVSADSDEYLLYAEQEILLQEQARRQAVGDSGSGGDGGGDFSDSGDDSGSGDFGTDSFG
ncbi:MAG: hypothetical protein WCS37_11335 [Chloroflexota bacterium]|nr:hypothetical protein [Chloroflexota bacterium]